MNLSNNKRNRNHPILDLTPMVDVVFLLIIFFLVATNFQKERSIPINLAKSSNAAEIKQNSKEETIILNEKGEFFINNNKFTKEKLKERLSNLPSNTAILFKADQNSNYKDVVGFLELLNETQLNQLNFVTEKE